MSNNTLELFRGIGIIIDDALNPKKEDKNDIIWKIKKSFESNNTPLLTYHELPDDSISHFHSISFLILDWDLHGLEPGQQMPDIVMNDNIEFIRNFNKVCFAPIFIFSNENINDIEHRLREAGLYDDLKSNHIFVEAKNDIKQSRSLFSKIKKWLKDTPSIHVLKEWEISLTKAKSDLFWDFYNINPNWPSILQQAFTSDGVDGDHELGTLVYKNLIARTKHCSFDEKIFKKRRSVKKEEIRKILECERFLKKEKLSSKPLSGDIFKKEDEGRTLYYINIRPDCDTIRENDNKIKLYLLKGDILDESHITQSLYGKYTFHQKNGIFIEKINHAIISFIDDGKIIIFSFRNLYVHKWNEYRDFRIGRLLPPYITTIQQKYTHYIQRQGLPAIPKEAIITKKNNK